MDSGYIKEVLYRTMLRMRNSSYGSRVYEFLDDIGVRIILSRLFNFVASIKMSIHPTDEMLESTAYFRGHKEEIVRVLRLLSDDLSRDTYKRMWEFRMHGKYGMLPGNSYKSQYFGNDYFHYENGLEVFIDCGAFDGDTVRSFKRTMARKGITGYRIVAFEPDKMNHNNLVRNHPDIKVVRAGCWDSRATLDFSPSADGSAIREQDASAETYEIDVVRLDDIDACLDATFIKMDIEGAEIRALEGARGIIMKNKPKLAICIYHSDNDMVRIPLMLHKMRPDYRMYVQQHSNSRYETVLYCV